MLAGEKNSEGFFLLHLNLDASHIDRVGHSQPARIGGGARFTANVTVLLVAKTWRMSGTSSARAGSSSRNASITAMKVLDGRIPPVLSTRLRCCRTAFGTLLTNRAKGIGTVSGSSEVMFKRARLVPAATPFRPWATCVILPLSNEARTTNGVFRLWLKGGCWLRRKWPQPIIGIPFGSFQELLSAILTDTKNVS